MSVAETILQQLGGQEIYSNDRLKELPSRRQQPENDAYKEPQQGKPPDNYLDEATDTYRMRFISTQRDA